jgi:tetratricopeptide (TPR) repeat protein
MSGGINEAAEIDLNAEIAELSAALSRNPRDAKAYRRRGLLKARSRRYDEALQDFERALRLNLKLSRCPVARLSKLSFASTSSSRARTRTGTKP